MYRLSGGSALASGRLAIATAVTTLQFTLTSALTVPFAVAAGTMVGTGDGPLYICDRCENYGGDLPAGVTTASVAATATCSRSGCEWLFYRGR